MRDPYTILGLARTATPDDIKSAFRRLAKRYHPDSNPGDPAAAGMFQDLRSAYALLKDSELRLRYDRGEIDANGAPRFNPFPRRHKPPRATAAAETAPPPPRKGDEEGEALFPSSSRAFAGPSGPRRKLSSPARPHRRRQPRPHRLR